MNRSGFLRSLATLIAAPSLIGNVKDAGDINTEREEAFIIPADRLRIYTPLARECRVGDKIHSDMGCGAVILSVVLIGEPFIEVRAMRRDGYYCKNPKAFYRAGSLFQES